MDFYFRTNPNANKFAVKTAFTHVHFEIKIVLFLVIISIKRSTENRPVCLVCKNLKIPTQSFIANILRRICFFFPSARNVSFIIWFFSGNMICNMFDKSKTTDAGVAAYVSVNFVRFLPLLNETVAL